MQFENIRTNTIIDRLIDLATNRSHSESIVVSSNMIPKRLANVILSSEEVEKLRGNRVEGWQYDLSTQATHAKSGISLRGCCQTFSHPVQSMAIRTLNIHFSQIMNRPIRTKRPACRRQNLSKPNQLNNILELEGIKALLTAL
jgi:hypothetical protein